MDLLNRLKNFDAYPKTMEDFRVRTISGAAVSIVSGLFIFWLFVSEFSYYLTTEVNPQLFVDTTRGEKLRINMDVIFPSMPCAFVSLDAMDISGAHQLDIQHNIYKKRLNQFGEQIPNARITREQNIGNEIVPAGKPEGDYCGSCYGAEQRQGDCCNTCEEVQEAYRSKGWAFANADGIEQCVREGFTKKLEEQQGEGCEIYGYLLVNKVAGNFHFAPGKSFQQHHMHVHDLQPLKFASFNLTHRIVKLSFGTEFPGLVNPLDGVVKGGEQSGGMFQYYIKIVPTIYEWLDGSVIYTNQFSVTENYRPVDDKSDHGLPGAFFMYDLSPIMVKFTETKKSFAHFLTGVCAIIGGVFTVAGIIDSFIYQGMRSLKKKIELGKER